MTGELVRADLLAALESEGKLTPVSLDLDDPDLSWDRFAALATFLGKLRNATAWWIGDLLNFGDAVHGFDASQAEALLDRSPETLRRWQWTCEKVPRSRRNPRVSFSHHETVAALPAGEQRVLLDLADSERLNLSEFRATVQRHRSAIEPAKCSAPNEPRAPASADRREPTPRSSEVVEAREAAAETAAASVCPTCGSLQLPIVEVEPGPKRKGEPWA